jgi:hypothetical protein
MTLECILLSLSHALETQDVLQNNQAIAFQPSLVGAHLLVFPEVEGCFANEAAGQVKVGHAGIRQPLTAQLNKCRLPQHPQLRLMKQECTTIPGMSKDLFLEIISNLTHM